MLLTNPESKFFQTSQKFLLKPNLTKKLPDYVELICWTKDDQDWDLSKFWWWTKWRNEISVDQRTWDQMSSTWELFTYVRLNQRTWNGAKLETEATGMIKGETNVRETQCHVRETITRTWRSFICTWNMNWRKAGKRRLKIFEESKTHIRETPMVTYAS